MRRSRKRKNKLIRIKFAFFVILIAGIMALIGSSIARYSSRGKSNATLDLAYYLFKEESISKELKLESILPRETPYEYTFLVANNDGENRTDVAIEYTMEIRTTTNLPLTYKVYNTDDETKDLASGTETKQDEDGTYFKHIFVSGGEFGHSKNEEHTYKIQVIFPKEYNLSAYEGIGEYVQITVHSNQKVK